VPLIRCASRIAPDEAGRRLDEFLLGWLPGRLKVEISRSAVRRIVMAGVVRVNGLPVRRPGMTLDAGWAIEARVDLGRLRLARPGVTAIDAGRMPAPDPSGVRILYRDRWLLAVSKPAGLLVHASADPGRSDLFTEIRRRLGAEQAAAGGKAGAVYLGLHHRLDVDTSGVMLFTIDPAANAALARAFSDHEVEKVYHALVGRPPAAAVPDRWTERGRLAAVGTGRRARMSVVGEGGVPAETSFAVADRFRHALLVEARPRTGRKHQVRAHLAAKGLPILGDVRYGGQAEIAGLRVARVMLHARALRLLHPVTGQPLDLECPYPSDFRDLLDRLSPARLSAGA
jgi:RluA family pseudouridine synthase